MPNVPAAEDRFVWKNEDVELQPPLEEPARDEDALAKRKAEYDKAMAEAEPEG